MSSVMGVQNNSIYLHVMQHCIGMAATHRASERLPDLRVALTMSFVPYLHLIPWSRSPAAPEDMSRKEVPRTCSRVAPVRGPPAGVSKETATCAMSSST